MLFSFTVDKRTELADVLTAKLENKTKAFFL